MKEQKACQHSIVAAFLYRLGDLDHGAGHSRYRCGRHRPLSTGAEEGGVGGLRRAMRASIRLSASTDHVFTITNGTACLPSLSVTILRNMLDSCDHRTGSEKSHGEMFRRPCCVVTRGRRGDRSRHHPCQGDYHRHSAIPPSYGARIPIWHIPLAGGVPPCQMTSMPSWGCLDIENAGSYAVPPARASGPHLGLALRTARSYA